MRERGQLLGAAEPDLYILQDSMPYSVNFLKEHWPWCRLCIIVGLAVALSTYLSGVLSLLATMLIYIFGFFTEHRLTTWPRSATSAGVRSREYVAVGEGRAVDRALAEGSSSVKAISDGG